MLTIDARQTILLQGFIAANDQVSESFPLVVRTSGAKGYGLVCGPRPARCVLGVLVAQWGGVLPKSCRTCAGFLYLGNQKCMYCVVACLQRSGVGA